MTGKLRGFAGAVYDKVSMKKLLLFFFTLFLSIALTTPGTTLAQGTSFEIAPEQEVLDDVVEKVVITFPELTGDGYRVCLNNGFCLKNTTIRAAAAKDPGVFVDKFLSAGLDTDEINSKELKSLEGNTITVCGAGDNALKTECTDDSKNYFHAGKFYILTVLEEQNGKWFSVGRAGFYVNHHLPTTKISPVNNKAPEKFMLDLTLDKLSKDGKKNSNNFQIVIEGRGVKEQTCTSDLKANETTQIPLPSNEWFKDEDNRGSDGKPPTGLIAGKYVIKVNERINDNNTKIRNDNCQGGYTFIHHICTVTNDRETDCRVELDPNQSDAGKFAELLDALAANGKGVPLPCKKSFNVRNPLECKEIDTAFGPIALDPIGFMTRIFSIVLSFAGLGALLLIIYSGYRLMISRGNKEAIQGARETLTAAILGLIFIIFSLVILSVIAGDILKIPGFN